MVQGYAFPKVCPLPTWSFPTSKYLSNQVGIDIRISRAEIARSFLIHPPNIHKHTISEGRSCKTRSHLYESHFYLSWIKCTDWFVGLDKQSPTVDKWWAQRALCREKQEPYLGSEPDLDPRAFCHFHLCSDFLYMFPRVPLVASRAWNQICLPQKKGTATSPSDVCSKSHCKLF